MAHVRANTFPCVNRGRTNNINNDNSKRQGYDRRATAMATTEHYLYHYPYASFTDAQLSLLKVAALYFDKLVLLNPVGASWDTVGMDHVTREAVRQLKDADLLEIVTLATVLAQYERRPTATSWSCATPRARPAAGSAGRSPWRRCRRACRPTRRCAI